MNIYNTFGSGLIDLVFGSGYHTKPATLAFGLTTTPPTNNSISEVANAAGYARQVLAPNTGAFGPGQNWNFPVVLSGIAYNNPPIYFPISTGSWGNVSGAFIADSASYGAGNILFYCTLSIPKDIELNDQFYIPSSGVSARFW
jgi:hypothetical protein